MLNVPQGSRARSSTHGASGLGPPPPFVAAGGGGSPLAPPHAAAAGAGAGGESQPAVSVGRRPSRPPPPTAEEAAATPRQFSFVSSTDALQGRRGAMEDSHISIDALARYYPDLFDSFQQGGLANALYGIYDGHVGKRASAFVSDTLHDRICRDSAFPVGSLLSLLAPGSADNVASGQESQGAKEAEEERPGPDGEGMCVEAAATTTTTIEQVTESICRAMEAGFLQTDREFIEDALKAENKWKDGSTAVVVLLLDSHIFVANVGDSEALLGKRKYNQSAGAWEESFEVLTEIHKPTVPAERARIEKEGGFIVGGRVGGLSVSRSFGDRNMKLPIEEDGFWHGVLVDPHPHVMHRQLSATDSFLLLGCDGVWENWSHQESVEFVFEKLDEGLSVDELTEAITRRAHAKGSQDNISATLLLFRWA